MAFIRVFITPSLISGRVTGISGPWWYASGATIQILLFAMLAAKLKLNAPYAHTWLEIVGARWGKVAHLVFMFFGCVDSALFGLFDLTREYQAIHKHHCQCNAHLRRKCYCNGLDRDAYHCCTYLLLTV